MGFLVLRNAAAIVSGEPNLTKASRSAPRSTARATPKPHSIDKMFTHFVDDRPIDESTLSTLVTCRRVAHWRWSPCACLTRTESRDVIGLVNYTFGRD
jgi:hypothetical protein